MKEQNRREFLKRTGLVTGVSLLAGAGVSWGQGSEAKSGNVGIAKPSRLRCEYLDDPESIDFASPGLSWEVMTDDPVARAVDQTAYQLFAASSLDLINVNRGDLWDSGKVESDRTVGVAHGGTPLGSRAGCYWKVRIWDQHGNVSKWSQTAKFSEGFPKTNLSDVTTPTPIIYQGVRHRISRTTSASP